MRIFPWEDQTVSEMELIGYTVSPVKVYTLDLLGFTSSFWISE